MQPAVQLRKGIARQIFVIVVYSIETPRERERIERSLRPARLVVLFYEIAGTIYLKSSYSPLELGTFTLSSNPSLSDSGSTLIIPKNL